MPKRHSALAGVYRAGVFGAGREAGGPGAVLTERRGLTLIHLAGRPSNAALREGAADVLSLNLPLEPNTVTHGGGSTAFWLAPTRWLVESASLPAAALEARLREAVAASAAAVADVSSGRTVLRIGGAEARALLAKGCPLDVHPAAFRPGTCAQSALAGVAVLIHALPDGGRFDLYGPRSYAVHLWDWLTRAAAEFGYRVEAPEGRSAW